MSRVLITADVWKLIFSFEGRKIFTETNSLTSPYLKGPLFHSKLGIISCNSFVRGSQLLISWSIFSACVSIFILIVTINRLSCHHGTSACTLTLWRWVNYDMRYGKHIDRPTSFTGVRFACLIGQNLEVKIKNESTKELCIQVNQTTAISVSNSDALDLGNWIVLNLAVGDPGFSWERGPTSKMGVLFLLKIARKWKNWTRGGGSLAISWIHQCKN